MSAPALQLRTFVLGPYETNCYVLSRGGRSWIIDAGFDSEEMIGEIEAARLTPDLLILTHAHPDHIAGVPAVLRAFPKAPVLIHRAERDFLADPELNLSVFLGTPISVPGPDRTLEEGDELHLDDLSFRVLHTPGHSPGGISLSCPAAGIVFAGDTLFAGSIGRTDFPGGDFDTLAESIRAKLYTLAPETKVFPGHGPPTTIGREIASNPFVRGK